MEAGSRAYYPPMGTSSSGTRGQAAGTRRRTLRAGSEPGSRQSKERAMRRRRLRKLWNRLCELQKMTLDAKALLIKIGEAKK
jgi:hypothetical protein